MQSKAEQGASRNTTSASNNTEECRVILREQRSFYVYSNS